MLPCIRHVSFWATLLAAGMAIGQTTRPAGRAWDDPSAVRTSRAPAGNADNFILYGYDREPYQLDPGPHLFVDYRYFLPGRTSYVFPDGSEAPRYDGDPTRLPEILGSPSQAPANVRIEAQKAEKTGVVLDNDQPWEYGIGYHTLLYFDGKYRLWYETIPPRNSKLGDRGLLCYAESDDGLKWVKPRVGIVDFEGNKDNNIVYGEPVAGHSFHGSSVFIDPLAPRSERLKLIYMSGTDAEALARFKAAHPHSVSPIGEQKKLFIRLAHSADGIHWTPRPNPVMSHMSDTQTTVYYDEYLKRYVAFFRLAYMNHRAIGRTETRRLDEPWPVPEVALFPQPIHDRPADDYYISGYSRYPGTRTMHIMIPTIYKRHTDSTELGMAASMDGEYWTWLPGGPVLEPGPDGSWDGGCVFGGIGLTELPDGRVVSPYVGYIYPHKFPRYERHMGRIGLAAWKKHRIAAVVADEEGEFVTGPLSAKGTSLLLNFQTRRNGWIKVSVEGKSSRSLDNCDRLFGDQIQKQVTWKGDGNLGISPGEDFALRFHLRAARLYSFEVR